MAIERDANPDLMREIECQRSHASPAEKALREELAKGLDGKKVRFKAPVYGQLIDYWCPTENLAIVLVRSSQECTQTYTTLRQYRVPVVFVVLGRETHSVKLLAREILAARPKARLLTSLVVIGGALDCVGGSSAPEKKPLQGKAPKAAPSAPAKAPVAPAGVPESYMKPLSSDLRPGRKFYTLVLPSGKCVLHRDWVRFRLQFSSHKGSPAAAFDSQAEAEAWIRSHKGSARPSKSERKKAKAEQHHDDRSHPEALPSVEITDEFREALDLLENSKSHVFITGKAGTGKSTLLKYFKLTTKKRIAVLAPTGVAAVNVRGQTIHSFFRFPTHYLSPDLYKDFKGEKVHRQLDALIIDEISMVRAEMFDAIEAFLRSFGPHPGKAFGGVQIICFGDPYQIPPVVPPDLESIFKGQIYKSAYFFSSQAFKQSAFKCIELTKIFRQQDQAFVRVLNQVRTGTLDDQGLALLNSRVLRADPADTELAMVLCPHKKTVSDINESRLVRLPGTSRAYRATWEGTFSYKELPVEETIHLKVGAQVMMLRNNPEKGFYNGTIAQVTKLGEDFIEVEIRKRNGKPRTVRVEPEEFEQVKHTVAGDQVKGRVIGSLKQIPVRLAWASTIHKSQGKTLDKVILDLSQSAFVDGQTYVALSRCTSLESLFLKEPIRYQDIMVNPIVEAFHRHCFPEPAADEEEFEGPAELEEGFARAIGT